MPNNKPPSLRQVLLGEGLKELRSDHDVTYEGFGLYAERRYSEYWENRSIWIVGNRHRDSGSYPGGKEFWRDETDDLRAYIRDHKERLTKKENGE